jgi:tetratricopeptide (TPR) repeat protein
MADVSKFIAKADEALKKRNYDYAIQMYESAMEADPGNAEARRNFRLALVRKYDAEGYPSSFGFGGMATKMISGKNPEKLLVETEKLVAKDPKSLKYNYRVAETLAALKHHEAACAVLEFAAKAGDLKADKHAPAVLMLLAKEYAETGKLDEANKVLQRATKLAPNDKNLKTLQKELSAKTYNAKVGTAKSSYDLVQNRDEANLLEKAKAGQLTDEDAEALIAQEEKKLQENPLDRRAVNVIADVMAKRRKFLEAANRLYGFLKLDPSATEIGDKAAKFKNQYYDGMIQLCIKKAAAEPDKAAAYQAKANELREERKKWQLEEYGRAVEAAPTDLEKRYFFGQALLDAGDHQEAFKQFQKAVKSPKYAKKAGLRMGQCLLTMGQIDMAEMAFRDVHKQLTEGDEDLKKDLMYFEADLMERKGDRTAALERFRALYMQDMEFRDVEKRIEGLRGEDAA